MPDTIKKKRGVNRKAKRVGIFKLFFYEKCKVLHCIIGFSCHDYELFL